MRSGASAVVVLCTALLVPPLVAQRVTPGQVTNLPVQVGTEPTDLNTASAGQLAALPGMGPVYARRIVEGRPYSAKNQLVTRGVLPRAAYEQVKERVVAHRPR